MIQLTNLLSTTTFSIPPLSKTTSPISLPVIPRIRLTLNEVIKCAKTILGSTAKLQGLQSVVDENPDILSTASARLALELFSDHPCRERDHLGIEPGPLGVQVFSIEVVWLDEQTEGTIYRDHLVIVSEVGVERFVERERQG